MQQFFMRASAILFVLSFVVVPGGFARASAAASVVGLYPGSTVSIGTNVSFVIQPSGFVTPTYWLVDSFPGGVTTVNINALGDFSWTPNRDEIGTHNLTITVSDATGNSATVSQQLIVNALPTVSVSSVTPGASVMIGVPVSFSISPSGLMNPRYSIADSFPYSSLRDTALNGAGVVTWTPIAQDIGTHTIVVTAQDSFGYTASTSQQIVVLAVPSLDISTISPGREVGVGEQFTLCATSTTLLHPTYTIQDAFVGLSTTTLAIDPVSGVVSWTPVYNDIGVHQISVSAVDSTGRGASTTLSIKVKPLPQGSTPPVTPTTTPASSVTTPVASTTATSTASTTTASTTPIRSSYTFKRLLTIGSVGADVIALQDVLTVQGVYTGPVTGYFGPLTRRAVAAFQSKFGISPVGYVGPGTRAVLNGQ